MPTITFTMDVSDEQYAKFLAWKRKTKLAYSGTIGGAYTYCFTPTAIGLALKVYHVLVPKKQCQCFDLTDYATW